MIVPYGPGPGARIIACDERLIVQAQEKHYEVGNPGSD